MTQPTPPSFRWPLATCPFSDADRAQIAKWITECDRYTMGARVAELEARFSEFSGMHALMVANGSVANQMVFEIWKLKNPGVKPLVIVPAVTWVSSISPALMAGMDIEFCDVNLDDFAFDYRKLDSQVARAVDVGRRVIIWPTALIGFAPDMTRIHQIAQDYGAEVFLDSCENTFSTLTTRCEISVGNSDVTSSLTPLVLSDSILASAAMTTTSCYNSHQVVSVEGGFVFFRDKDDYDLGRLLRNHGLVRSLAPDHPLRLKIQNENPDVDPQFLFALAGTNLRPTDVHAMFGLADFKRIPESIDHRKATYRLFQQLLDPGRYYLPQRTDSHVGFCLPIFTRWDNLAQVNAALTAAGIERRPIIGANLLYQPPFRAYGTPADFPNAEWIHRHGTYVGLHSEVTPVMVLELTTLLNDLPVAHAKAA